MQISRRLFHTGMASSAAAAACFGQGMAARKVVVQPRGKPSGLPFNAHFTDVAAQSGLHAVTVYGPVDHKEYIAEIIGCGCDCAFIDYDNDGWLDIFLLCGTRFADPPKDATNRLFRNNRDGTFTDVTEKAGLVKDRMGVRRVRGDYNNDGFEDLFVTYCSGMKRSQ